MPLTDEELLAAANQTRIPKQRILDMAIDLIKVLKAEEHRFAHMLAATRAAKQRGQSIAAQPAAHGAFQAHPIGGYAHGLQGVPSNPNAAPVGYVLDPDLAQAPPGMPRVSPPLPPPLLAPR